MKTPIPPAEAYLRILGALAGSRKISVPINEASGHILRQEVIADRPLPPFDRSMMDGYAVRYDDLRTRTEFSIVGQIPAGSPSLPLGTTSGSCVEIMTGAMIPPDADCVIPYEETEPLDDGQIRILLPEKFSPRDFIHFRGSDQKEGSVLIKPGRKLGSREIAVAASVGLETIAVSETPTIAIVSTGDELVDVGETPKEHQIRRSNDLMISTALKLSGLADLSFHQLRDDPTESRATLSELISSHDVVIVSGGISMGKLDHIPEALDQLGLSCLFHGVLQKPGRPMGCWAGTDTTVLTLPGNPLSALTCLHHHVIPALKHALGISHEAPKHQVQLTEPVRARDDLSIFLPVILGPENRATPSPFQNSGDLVRILKSDGYIFLQPTREKSYPAQSSWDFHPWH